MQSQHNYGETGLAAERPAHQPPRARHRSCQNAHDLAREAVGCMGMLDGGPWLHVLQTSQPLLSTKKFHKVGYLRSCQQCSYRRDQSQDCSRGCSHRSPVYLDPKAAGINFDFHVRTSSLLDAYCEEIVSARIGLFQERFQRVIFPVLHD